jgi:hypothetical protein
MATLGRSEATFGSQLSENSTLTPYTGVRCPCCASMVEHLPLLWTIEPCRVCRRPLVLARAIGRRRLFYLRNLLDIAGAIYGVATLGFVLAFVLSELDARAFVKVVTILLFFVGSLLAVDGLLSCRTGIDRTWNVTRRGVVARLLGVCKIASAALALWLVAIGVSL